MNTNNIGFIGGGRIARILLEGWRRAGALPEEIVVYDPNPAALEALRSRFPAVVTTNEIAVAASRRIVILATHPPVTADVLKAVHPSLGGDAILVSLAPKFTIARISELLGGFGRIVRSNPSAPSIVGRGNNPVVFSAELGAEERRAILELWAPLGACPEVEEAKIEAYALITAMGPTYLWFQMQALRELAVQFGLSPREADEALLRMVDGAAQTLVDPGLEPAEVMNLVPVRPLAEMESGVLDLYKTRLPALFAKIKP